jgi:hypothetical protein
MNLLPVTNSEDADSLRKLPTLAIDLGFAEKSTSCGLSEHQQGYRFADAVTETAAWLSRQTNEAVLILEAPLSGSFDTSGNPCARGRFETHHDSGNSSGRRWQSGAGASMALAALHFLRLISEAAKNTDLVVHLVEGFCSRYGDKKPSDTAVANELLKLWKTGEELIKVTGPTNLSTITILDSEAPAAPPAILRVPDGFC